MANINFFHPFYFLSLKNISRNPNNTIQTYKKMEPVNIKDKLKLIQDYWKPKIAGELNGQQVKLVKIKGEFVMHKHDHEDELFLVIKGLLKIEFENRIVDVNEGEFIIIPRGVKHRSIADKVTHILLFEPSTTINTGDVSNYLTLKSQERI